MEQKSSVNPRRVCLSVFIFIDFALDFYFTSVWLKARILFLAESRVEFRFLFVGQVGFDERSNLAFHLFFDFVKRYTAGQQKQSRRSLDDLLANRTDEVVINAIVAEKT